MLEETEVEILHICDPKRTSAVGNAIGISGAVQGRTKNKKFMRVPKPNSVSGVVKKGKKKKKKKGNKSPVWWLDLVIEDIGKTGEVKQKKKKKRRPKKKQIMEQDGEVASTAEQYQNVPSYNHYVPIQQLNQHPSGGAPRPPPAPIPVHAGGPYRGRGGHWRPPQEDTFPQRRHERRRRSHLDDIYLPNYEDEDELDAIEDRYRGSFHHRRKYPWRAAEHQPPKNRHVREIEITPTLNNKTDPSKLDKKQDELLKNGDVEQCKVVTSSVNEDGLQITEGKCSKDTSVKLILDVDDKTNTTNSETKVAQINNSSDTQKVTASNNDVDSNDLKISETEDESAINSNCATANPETDKQIDDVEGKTDSAIPTDVPKCTLEPEVKEITSSQPLPKTFPIWEPFDPPRGRIASVREVESDEETICFDDFITIDRIDTTRSYLSATTPDFDDLEVIDMIVDPSTPSPDDLRVIDMDTGTPSPCKRKTDEDESAVAKKTKYERLYHDINSDRLLREIDEVLMDDKGVTKPAKAVIRYRSKSLTEESGMESIGTHSTKSKSLDCINKNQSQVSCHLDLSTNLLLLLDDSYSRIRTRKESDIKAPLEVHHVPRTDPRTQPRLPTKAKIEKSESHVVKEYSERKVNECSDAAKPSLMILSEYKKSMDLSKKILPPEMVLQKIMSSPAKLKSRRTTFSDENDLHIKKMHRLFGSDSDPEDDEAAEIHSDKNNREKISNKKRKSDKSEQRDPQPKKLFSINGNKRDGQAEGLEKNRRYSVPVVSETKAKSKEKRQDSVQGSEEGGSKSKGKESRCPSTTVAAPSTKLVEESTKMSKNDVLHTGKQIEKRRGSSPVCTTNNGMKSSAKTSSNGVSSKNNDKDKPKTLSNHKRTSTDGKHIQSLKDNDDKGNIKEDTLKKKIRWDVTNFIKSDHGKPSQKSTDCSKQKQTPVKDKKASATTAVNKPTEERDVKQNKKPKIGVVIDTDKTKTTEARKNVKTEVKTSAIKENSGKNVTVDNKNNRSDVKTIKDQSVKTKQRDCEIKTVKTVTIENKNEKYAKPILGDIHNSANAESEKTVKTVTIDNKNEECVSKLIKDSLQNPLKTESEINIKHISEKTVKTVAIENRNEKSVAKPVKDDLQNSVKQERGINSKENSEKTVKTETVKIKNEVVVAKPIKGGLQNSVKTECQIKIIKENSETNMKTITVENDKVDVKNLDISLMQVMLQPKLILEKIDNQGTVQSIDKEIEVVFNYAAVNIAPEPIFAKCCFLPKDQFPLSQRARFIAVQEECCDKAVTLEQSDVRDTVETVKIRKKSLNVVIAIQPTEDFYEVIDLTDDKPDKEALHIREEQEIDLGLNDVGEENGEERITLYRSEETLNNTLEVQAMVASMTPSTLNKTKPEGDKKSAISEEISSNDKGEVLQTNVQYLTKLLVEKAVEAAKDQRKQEELEIQTTNPSHNTIKLKYTPGTFISHGTVQDLGDSPAQHIPEGPLMTVMHNLEELKRQKLQDVRRTAVALEQGSGQMGLLQQNCSTPQTTEGRCDLVPQVPRRAEENAAQKSSSTVVQCPGGIRENIPFGFIAQMPRSEVVQAIGQTTGDNVSQISSGFVGQTPRRIDDVTQMNFYQQVPRTETTVSVHNKPQMTFNPVLPTHNSVPSFSSMPQPQRPIIGNPLSSSAGQKSNGNNSMTFISTAPAPSTTEDPTKQMHPLRREGVPQLPNQILGRENQAVNVRESEPPPLVDFQVHMQRNVMYTLTKYVSFYHNLRNAQGAYQAYIVKLANVFPDLVNAELHKFNADTAVKFHALSKCLVTELLKVNMGLMFTFQNYHRLVSNVHKMTTHVVPECTLSWVYLLLETIIGLEAAEYIKVPYLRELYSHVLFVTSRLRARKGASQNGAVPSSSPPQETLTAQDRQRLEWQIQQYNKICFMERHVQSYDEQTEIFDAGQQRNIVDPGKANAPAAKISQKRRKSTYGSTLREYLQKFGNSTDASKSSPSPSYGYVTVQTSCPQTTNANVAVNSGSIPSNSDGNRNALEALENFTANINTNGSQLASKDSFKIRLPYTRPYDMPAPPSSATEGQRNSLALNASTTSSATSNKDNCDISISNSDQCIPTTTTLQSRSMPVTGLQSSVPPINVAPNGPQLNGQPMISVADRPQISCQIITNPAAGSQMANQPIARLVNTQITDQTTISPASSPLVVTQQPIDIPEVTIQPITTPVTTTQVISQPITKPVDTPQAANSPEVTVEPSSTPVINPQMADQPVTESASSQPTVGDECDDVPQVKLEMTVGSAFEDGEVIDLTWMNDIDPEQLQNEIKYFEVKKEEAAEMVEEAVQEDGPLRDEYAANSPADSGISSPPMQIEYNEQVFLHRTCICGQSAEYVCGCMSAMYCSVPCQLKHWTSHKELCLKQNGKYKVDNEPQQDDDPSAKNFPK